MLYQWAHQSEIKTPPGLSFGEQRSSALLSVDQLAEQTESEKLTRWPISCSLSSQPVTWALLKSLAIALTASHLKRLLAMTNIRQ